MATKKANKQTIKTARRAGSEFDAAAGYTRRPLAVGNIYRFRGYAKNGFKIVGMSLPGTPSDDGGLPGVAVQWINRTRERGWYPFRSETEFWSYPYFANAEDPEACGYNNGDEPPRG